MNTHTDQPAVKRILVALNDAASGREAVEAAARLAAELNVEMLGLYLEDDNVPRLAGLPFVREITFASGLERPIDAESLQRALRKKEERVRQAVASTADRAHVAWSFSVTQGHGMQRVLAVTSDTDIVLLGCRSHAPLSLSAVPGLAHPAARPVVAAVMGVSPASRRVLDAAGTLARQYDCEVIVLIHATDRDSFLQLAGEVRRLIIMQHAQVNVVACPVCDTETIARSVHSRRGGLLLVSRTCPLLDEANLESLVDNLDCPVGLV